MCLDKPSRIEYITIYVKCKTQAVNYYQEKLHFVPEGPWFRAGDIKIYLVEEHTASPKDQQVVDIAFAVDSVSHIFQRALLYGAQVVFQPRTVAHEQGQLYMARVSLHNNVTFTFIDPTLSTPSNKPQACSSPLTNIDHITFCLPYGDALDYWAGYFENVHGLKQTYEEYVVTERTGMDSKVFQSQDGAVKIVLVRPVLGTDTSQVADFVEHYVGPCVQHIAFSTDDIMTTVKKLRETGIRFLPIPDKYYQKKEKTDNQKINYSRLKELNILGDSYQNGFLFQAFTVPENPYPSLFYEIIERQQCEGFSSGNIHALFQAMEG
ncbi:VOC family protein [Legionella oakridgensis]|uniref:VOC family protein n=1 Tax=Legionella oakridgensis TaxID=29423 RepID=UPI0003DE460D|nr:VOC family protein [Legionella oakridgensis]ETO92072.1 4-hydroxyphenylpyruvate dioxygenase [Legionella oakridgensis RV-2-2007]